MFRAWLGLGHTPHTEDRDRYTNRNTRCDPASDRQGLLIRARAKEEVHVAALRMFHRSEGDFHGVERKLVSSLTSVQDVGMAASIVKAHNDSSLPISPVLLMHLCCEADLGR